MKNLPKNDLRKIINKNNKITKKNFSKRNIQKINYVNNEGPSDSSNDDENKKVSIFDID